MTKRNDHDASTLWGALDFLCLTIGSGTSDPSEDELDWIAEFHGGEVADAYQNAKEVLKANDN